MATTINNYSVGLTLDAKDYIDGSKLSRAETRALISDINKARTPAEEFSRAQDRLKKAYDAGAISLETYNRLLDKHKSKLDSGKEAADKKSNGLERMSHAANIVTGSIAAIRGAIDTVSAAKSAFDDVANRIASTSDAARTLGVTFNELTSLRFAGQQAGASIESIEGAIKQMMKRGFAGNDVRESFLSIADEISGMASQTERMQRAYEVFGKQGADIVLMLQEGRAAIEENVAFAEKWSSLSDSQTIAAEQYGDALDRVSIIVSGIADLFVSEIAPLFEAFLLDAENSASSFDNLDQFAKDTVDNLAIGLGVVQDVYELTTSWWTVLQKIAAGDFTGGIKAIDEAISFDNAEKNLQKLYDVRAKNDALAAQRAKERAEKQTQIEVEQIEEVALIEEQKVENFDSLYKQAIANSTKEFERKAAEVKKMADSIARGPADIEAGSAGAAQYMANSVNRALADTLLSDVEQPGQQALAEEAAKQLEQLMLANQKQSEQVSALQQLVEITSNNGFKRLR